MLICCIVKPPVYEEHHKIIFDLTQQGIVIVDSKDFWYNAEVINVLYDHMDQEAQFCIGKKYASSLGCALLLQMNSIELCKEIIGKDSDPIRCEPYTIRAKYGSRISPEYIGSWLWWENAIHRPIDERERIRDLVLVFPEYIQDAG